MQKLFFKYVSVGVLNTIIHYCVFFILYIFFSQSQAVSNLIAFCVAVTFSFFVNAKWTFDSHVNFYRYIAFICFMGLLSFLVGYLSDLYHLNIAITLIGFSIISLILGFLYSKYLVFRK